MKLAYRTISILTLACAFYSPSAGKAQDPIVNEMGKPPMAPPVMSSPKVELKLKTDKKSYSDSDAIKITFTIKNKQKEEASISFSDGQKYDFELRKGKDMKAEKVWQLAKGRMSIMVVTTSKIAPGKELTFTETYKPGEKGGDGKPLPKLTAGTYSLTGVLRTVGRTPRPIKTITFQVN